SFVRIVDAWPKACGTNSRLGFIAGVQRRPLRRLACEAAPIVRPLAVDALILGLLAQIVLQRRIVSPAPRRRNRLRDRWRNRLGWRGGGRHIDWIGSPAHYSFTK